MVLRELGILLRMCYVRNFSVLKRRRNLKMLLLFFFFGYLIYALANSTQLSDEKTVRRTKESPAQEILLDKLDGDDSANKRASELVANEWKYYSVIKNNGIMGKALDIKKESLTPIERAKMEEGWKNHAFNEYISNLIPLNRTLTDIRFPGCKKDLISPDLPTSTIIMCFHNEAWSVLLRSVYSIIDRSPPNLINEILLVDDFSDFPHLFEPLYIYLRENFGNKVRVLRNNKREGLIRSRLHGARKATGDVLIFLDSHIECSPGWLEPLLQLIKDDKTVVVTPLIDIIDKENFAYKYNRGSKVSVGGFNWDLVFTWHVAPDEDLKDRSNEHMPVRSPTMAGGLFAISKEYFSDIGTYDAGMEIWGGENLEISFRIWMCGGTLLTVPCSRIGHIFRDRSPYKWKPGTNVVQKNSIRVAEVWMDDYKKIYYEKKNIDQRTVLKEDVSARKALRKNLHCKSFQWYLDNIYPTLWNPNYAVYKGPITLLDGTYAIFGETYRKKIAPTGKPIQVESVNILINKRRQDWFMSKANEIRIDEACFDYPGGINGKDKPNKLITFSCHSQRGNQEFHYKNNQIIHGPTGLCVKVDLKSYLVMSKCDETDPKQLWHWTKYENTVM